MGLGATLSAVAGVFRGQKTEMSFGGACFLHRNAAGWQKSRLSVCFKGTQKAPPGPHHRIWLGLTKE